MADLVEAAWVAQFNAYLIARYGNVLTHDVQPAAHQFDWSDNTHPSIDYTYTTRRTNEREP